MSYHWCHNFLEKTFIIYLQMVEMKTYFTDPGLNPDPDLNPDRQALDADPTVSRTKTLVD